MRWQGAVPQLCEEEQQRGFSAAEREGEGKGAQREAQETAGGQSWAVVTARWKCACVSVVHPCVCSVTR